MQLTPHFVFMFVQWEEVEACPDIIYNLWNISLFKRR